MGLKERLELDKVQDALRKGARQILLEESHAAQVKLLEYWDRATQSGCESIRAEEVLRARARMMDLQADLVRLNSAD